MKRKFLFFIFIFIFGLISISSPLIVNLYETNPNLRTFSVEIDNGVKISYRDYSITFIPYFVMKNGQVYTWNEIPNSIQKDLWREKMDNNRYKYGVDFSNISTAVKNNLNYVVLHRVDSSGLNWADVKVEGNTIIIKDKVFISHDDIISTYTIPIINRTDIVIGGLNRNWTECLEIDEDSLDCLKEIIVFNWKNNGDGTWNISFDPQITISEASVVSTAILNNVTSEGNFTHLNISTTAPYNRLVGYWNFDGDKIDTTGFTAYDFSNNNYNGVGEGTISVSSTNCIYGECLVSDGNNTSTDPLVNLPAFTIAGNQSVAFSLWIKPENGQFTSTDARLIDGSTDECVVRIGTDIDDAEIILNTFGTNDRVSSGASTVTMGVWNHIFAQYNNITNNMSIFINGVNKASVIPTGKYGTCNDWYLAARAQGQAGSMYNGSMDEVMIFATALTDAQILEIYNNQSARFVTQGTQDISMKSLCYQETANVSTACGGLDTGKYWTTDYYFYINYTKPAWFWGAYWKVKHGNSSNYTVAIPNNCFNNPVQLRFLSADDPILTFVSSSRGECKSSTGWGVITPYLTGDNGTWSAGGLNYPYDGNWETAGEFNEDSVLWGTGTNSSGLLYEEGIYWVSGGENGFNGSNRVNVTTYIENNLGSSINLTIKFENVSGGFYTVPQVISSGIALTFNISSIADAVNISYTFYAGNSTNPFHSPILKENITVDYWYEEEEEAPAGDTTPPIIQYLSPTGTPGSTLKINITANDTQSNISVFTDIDRDLLLWLRMDELNASNDIIDNSSWKSNCDAVGGQQITNGKLGEGWQPLDIGPLAEGKDAIDCGNSTRFTLTNQLTLAGWFNVSGNYSGGSQSGIRRDDSFVTPYVYNGYTLLSAWIKNATTWYSVMATSTPLSIQGKWTHIASTYNGTTLTIYINGILENSSLVSGNITNNGNNVWIGKEVGAPLYFNGSFDDILIFNRSLTKEEIADLYANQTTKNIYREYNVGEGTHNYTSWAQDTAGNVNRIFNITNITIDAEYPQFSIYWDDNATVVGSGIGHFNVTVTNTNGTVILHINNTNILATNLTANVYNVSYNFTSGGTYLYNWTAYGNGTIHNLNTSINRYYTVNVSGCIYTLGNWDISTYCEFSNQNFNINGNLSLFPSGILNITNCTLNFTAQGQWLIFHNVTTEIKLIMNSSGVNIN